MTDGEHLSARRQWLTSFERCYAVAIQKRRHSGMMQMVLRTDNPLQPFRTTGRPPGRGERIMALIL